MQKVALFVLISAIFYWRWKGKKDRHMLYIKARPCGTFQLHLLDTAHLVKLPINDSFWSNFEPVKLRYLKNATSCRQIMTSGSF